MNKRILNAYLKKGENNKPIIKLTNTKTNERGYLLPMRTF